MLQLPTEPRHYAFVGQGGHDTKPGPKNAGTICPPSVTESSRRGADAVFKTPPKNETNYTAVVYTVGLLRLSTVAEDMVS